MTIDQITADIRALERWLAAHAGGLCASYGAVSWRRIGRRWRLAVGEVPLLGASVETRKAGHADLPGLLHRLAEAARAVFE